MNVAIVGSGGEPSANVRQAAEKLDAAGLLVVLDDAGLGSFPCKDESFLLELFLDNFLNNLDDRIFVPIISGDFRKQEARERREISRMAHAIPPRPMLRKGNYRIRNLPR
jgi:hypothetical protein